MAPAPSSDLDDTVALVTGRSSTDRAGTRTIRFGVGASGIDTIDQWREIAVTAEALGYSSLLLGDHVVDFLPVGGASPLLALAAAAAATSELRLGTMLCNDLRHPLILAKDAATLDVISGGRLELGVGAGWHRPDYVALGIDFDPASIRIRRLGEALEILTRAWSGSAFDFAGEHYRIGDYAGTPTPARPGGPLLLVGGGGPKILRLAGSKADIVGVHVSTVATDAVADSTFENTARKIGWVREGAGERFDDIELQMACSFALTDGSRDRAVAAARSRGMTVETLEHAATTMVGDRDQVAEQILRRRDELGVSYFLVSTDDMEALAPVVADLTGR